VLVVFEYANPLQLPQLELYELANVAPPLVKPPDESEPFQNELPGRLKSPNEIVPACEVLAANKRKQLKTNRRQSESIADHLPPRLARTTTQRGQQPSAHEERTKQWLKTIENGRFRAHADICMISVGRSSGS
jgi:hypothetical protein